MCVGKTCMYMHVQECGCLFNKTHKHTPKDSQLVRQLAPASFVSLFCMQLRMIYQVQITTHGSHDYYLCTITGAPVAILHASQIASSLCQQLNVVIQLAKYSVVVINVSIEVLYVTIVMTTKLHHCATQVVHWLMAAGLPLETLTKKIAILGMLSY